MVDGRHSTTVVPASGGGSETTTILHDSVAVCMYVWRQKERGQAVTADTQRAAATHTYMYADLFIGHADLLLLTHWCTIASRLIVVQPLSWSTTITIHHHRAVEQPISRLTVLN